MYRKDRMGRVGGGVAAYVHEDIVAIRRDNIEFDNIAVMWLELQLTNITLLLCVIYRPPNCPVDF